MVIKYEDNEIFGYYYDSGIESECSEHKEKLNSKSFHFNLQSKNNRLNKPMKFEIKESRIVFHRLFSIYHHELMQIGNICLHKNNWKNDSYCKEDENMFDYHGIDNALCGKKMFNPQRFLIIQMK